VRVGALALPLNASRVEVFCRFGAAPLSAVAEVAPDGSEVLCVAPSAAAAGVADESGAGAVDVAVLHRSDGLVFVAATRFLFVPVVRIDGASPLMVDERGGALVTVVGSGFAAAPSLACRFRFGAAAAGEAALEALSAAVPARRVDDATLECAMPRARALGAARLEISVNGADWLAAPAALTILPAAIVASIEPVLGTTRGGTRIVLRGAGLRANALAAACCEFGDARVPAAFASGEEAVCVSPPAPLLTPTASGNGNATVGIVSIAVAVRFLPDCGAARTPAGSALAEASAVFRYVEPRGLTLSPASGALEGGAEVRLTAPAGSAAMAALRLAVDASSSSSAAAAAAAPFLCRFGVAAATPAVLLRDGSVAVCVAPPASEAALPEAHRDDSDAAGAADAATGARAAVLVPVRFSLNGGADWVLAEGPFT
jgi:hypothetical protein